jgi:hypothetical protein
LPDEFLTVCDGDGGAPMMFKVYVIIYYVCKYDCLAGACGEHGQDVTGALFPRGFDTRFDIFLVFS